MTVPLLDCPEEPRGQFVSGCLWQQSQAWVLIERIKMQVKNLKLPLVPQSCKLSTRALFGEVWTLGSVHDWFWKEHSRKVALHLLQDCPAFLSSLSHLHVCLEL